MQRDSEQAAVVVGVRGTALREAEIGVALSLCLLLVLAASHPNWKGMGIYTALAAAVYTGARAASKFRSRLDDAVSLPTEAVETLGRPKRPPLGRKWALALGAILIAAIGAFFALGWNGLDRGFVDVAAAALIADGLARPLATAYFAARWERRHGRARLFRPLVRAEKGEETLYVADRPVPAA
jgi:hypothetical protein